MPGLAVPPLASSFAEGPRSARSYSISAGSTFPESDYSRPLAPRPSSPPDPFDLTDESPPMPTAPSLPSPIQEESSSSRLSPARRTLGDHGSVGSRSRTPSPSRARSRPLSNRTSRAASPVGSSSRTGSPLKRPYGTDSREHVISLPQLTTANMFIALQGQNDPLQVPLTKYIAQSHRPPRDVIGVYDGLEVPQLLAMNSWRAIANLARDTIRTCNPEDTTLIFDMFHLRHVALLALHLPTHHARELHLLFSAIGHLSPTVRSHLYHQQMVPFSLEVMLAKSRGGVDALSALLRRCKLAARRARTDKPDEKALWIERGIRVGVTMAGVLVDIGDSVAALTLLAPLSSSPTAPPYILSSIQRLLISTGDLPAAAVILQRIVTHPSATATEKSMAEGLFAIAAGDNKAADLAFSHIAHEKDGQGEGLVAANASSVAALYRNELDRAITILETAIEASPSSVLIEPIIFNLATLYELRMGQEACLNKKVDLLMRVAEWGGDGIRPACLKL